ncbi:subclass B1 metallo-beta-lactamase [Roseivirga spongicola]|uniref:subclass B1 metallo-beta-lactamase n=1 Tax=Roseivirga spongicola TaxID=333140 RepID=UPI002AC969D5|nr:subclass B1 metallo-beta-lactamase [Roseivirga spongicola]WPZ09226.1 subclass B1 metallo-beta-lactamase [Roseivirga spongicola]
MKNRLLSFIFLCLTLFSCNQANTESQTVQKKTQPLQGESVVYKSETLSVVKLSDHTYLHISYLDTEAFGKVPCNGMFIIYEGESVVFDTPTNSENSRELIRFISSELKSKIVALIPTHFHEDCIGGIDEFDAHGITTYASKRTITLLNDNKYQFNVPINAFRDSLELKLSSETVVTHFLGEGHTEDNVVGYFSKDKVLFGGCLVKSVGASQGNLDDANVEQWSTTVANVKAKFPEASIVIPGHGKTGNTALLDYTIKLFNDK